MGSNCNSSPIVGACASCGETKLVEFLEDPFLSEVYDESEYAWICEDCYDQKVADI